MNLVTQLKNSYLECRKIVRAIFFYPKQTIDPSVSLDYDAYWEKKRGSEVGVLSSWQRARAEIVAAQLAGDDLTIADIGCGEGSILKFLKEQVPGISRIVGYDSSPFVLEKARAIGAETVEFNLLAPGWEDTIEPCDYALLLEVIEHMADAEKVAGAALAKARKGIFVSVPNSGYFTFRLRLLFGKFPAQWINFPNEHLRFWTHTDMRWWLRALGHEHAHIRTYKGIPLLNRLWPALFAAGLVVFIPKE